MNFKNIFKIFKIDSDIKRSENELKILSLSIEEAQIQAYEEINLEKYVTYTLNIENVSLPEVLTINMRNLFARWTKVSCILFCLSIDEFEDYKWVQGYYQIGSINEGFILIKLYEDQVYIVGDDELPSEQSESYKSIYHFILKNINAIKEAE